MATESQKYSEPTPFSSSHQVPRIASASASLSSDPQSSQVICSFESHESPVKPLRVTILLDLCCSKGPRGFISFYDLRPKPS